MLSPSAGFDGELGEGLFVLHFQGHRQPWLTGPGDDNEAVVLELLGLQSGCHSILGFTSPLLHISLLDLTWKCNPSETQLGPG